MTTGRSRQKIDRHDSKTWTVCPCRGRGRVRGRAGLTREWIRNRFDAQIEHSTERTKHTSNHNPIDFERWLQLHTAHFERRTDNHYTCASSQEGQGHFQPQRDRKYLQLQLRPTCRPSHGYRLSLIHISEPTRQAEISYAVFCLKKKKKKN